MESNKRTWNLFLYLVLVVLLASSVVACLSLPGSAPPDNKPSPTPETPQTNLPVIVNLEVSPTKVTIVEPVTLRWEVNGANNVTIDHDIGEVPSSGTKQVILSQSIVYKLTATNNRGSVSRTASVMVYENVKASQIALTEEDVNPSGFIFSQNTEPQIDDTISTYYIRFARKNPITGRDEILDNGVSIHNTVEATEKLYLENKSNAVEIIANIVTIGDEGYAVKFLGLYQAESTAYVIRFRKNNVYVNIGTLINYQELESFARIVELRIR